jgi:gliding motility-associated-like protein
MKILRYSVFLLCCLCSFTRPGFAQKEAANWYFGEKAGMRFNLPASPQPVFQTNSKMLAIEGCASISDSLGNLLFYTAGDTVYTVYNGQHKKMDNGYLLSGHQSATQSSLIVPQPGSNRYYYLFTLDAVGGTGGLKYSVVDVQAPNGGKVMAKNIPLLSSATEKITAVNHRSTRDIWVIAHGFGTQNGGKFYAYRVSANGIANPVISTIGLVHGPQPQDAVGALKASPDGTKLALAMEGRNLVQTFDFNDETGTITNAMTFTGMQWAYGLEFTPDGSKLFISTVSNILLISSLDLLAARFDRDSISRTMQGIGASAGKEGGAMQLAPNYMIYIAMPRNSKISSLGQVNTPIFQPNFRDQSFSVDPGNVRKSRQGLPAFNQSYFYRPHFTSTSVCIGDTSKFKIPGRKQFKSVHWTFRDPGSGKDSISSVRNPFHIFSKVGRFMVTLTVTFPNNRVYSNTIPVDVAPLPVFSMGPDLEICPNDSVKIKAPKSLNALKWSTGEIADSIYVYKPGRYFLTMTNSTGCSYQDTIEVRLKPGPPLFKQRYYEMCIYRSVQLKKEYTLGDFWWEDKTRDSVFTAKKVGWVKGYGVYNGCTFVDSVEVGYKECLEDLMVPNIITPNGDDLNDTFTLQGLKPGDWHLQIYNRWGTLIYDDKNYRNNWPKELPAAGTYYFLMQKPGTTLKLKGWLEVVR